MGAVKNLFVRIGGDASGAVNSFKNASKAAGSAKENIKKASADTKRSIRDGFASSTPSIKEYMATVARTKEAHQAAVQNVGRLSDKIAQLEDVYGTIKNATDGLDLSKSLESQIADAEKQLETINAKIVKTQAAIGRIGNPRSAVKVERLATLQDELRELMADSDETAAHLNALDVAADRVGESNMGYASASGLKSLQAEIDATKAQLRTTQAVVDETGQKLQSMKLGPMLGRMLKNVGASAKQAMRSGVSALGNGLRRLGGNAARGLASLPGKLLGIGKSASAGCGGLRNMVRSIRNIGVVSLGLRIASGMFGQLRSVISNYISENKALSKSVDTVKMQLGEAMAPAINLVLAGLQRLMPVVTSVANAISSIFTALFGKVSVTSKAISKSAASAGAAADSLDVYGFDQITKVSDNSSGGGSSAIGQQTKEQSALVKKLTSWIQQLKAAFVAGDWTGLGALIGDGINRAFSALEKFDVGGKIGTFVNNVITVLHSALTRIDFSKIGKTIGGTVTSMFQKIDWKMAGETIGKALVALPATLVGFIVGTDWALVGNSLSDCIRSAIHPVAEFFRTVDLLKIGQSILDFIRNVDWMGISGDLYSCVWGAVVNCGTSLGNSIEIMVKSIGEYFTGKIAEAGGNVAKGLWNGIVEGLGDTDGRINDQVLKPFVNGFCNAFGLPGPSKVMFKLAKLLPEGILNGIKSVDLFQKIGTWLNDKILKPVSNGLGSLKAAMPGFFSGLWSGMKGWINKIIGGFESMVNGIIRGVNKMLDGLNKITDVSKYIGIDLSISKIKTVNLPRLAKGGVVDQPTAAVIGEAGKEAVMPLENNTGWITQLAKQINQQGGNTPTSLALAIYFRSRKLAEYVIQDINQITKETGTCPIYV